LGKKRVALQSRPVCTLSGLAAGWGKGFGAGFAARGFGFGDPRLIALAAFGEIAFDTADFDDTLGFDDFGFALACERGLAIFARLAGLVFALARGAFAFAETDFGFLTVTLAAFRFAAGFTLDARFREGAGLAAALPRFVVFAMVLASIPPAGTACGRLVRAAARLQFKRGF
jgi:hypothetical protein